MKAQKLFFGLCILALFVSVVMAKDKEEECEVANVDLYWDDEYYNEEAIGITHTIKTKNVEKVEFGNSDYLKGEFDGSEIKFTTTDKFAKYEETGTGTKIKVLMNITCKNNEEYKLKFAQKIKDINDHEPTFNAEKYNFIYYGQIPKNFQLTKLISITATDLDCSPDRLNFEIDSDDFSIDSEQEGKTATVRLQTRKTISPGFEKEFTITVKDYDEYYDEKGHEVKAILKIKVLDSEHDFKFTKENYAVSTKDNHVVDDEVIEMITGVDDDVDVEIEDSEYSDYFTVDIDYLRGVIRLYLDEKLPQIPTKYSESGSVSTFELKLKATWKGLSTETIVTVTPENSIALLCIVPGIDLDYDTLYNSKKLDDNHIGSVFEITGIKNVEDMTCEGSKYLDCNFDKVAGQFNILTNDSFKTYEDTESEEIIRTKLTIQCPYEDTKIIEFIQEINDINNHNPVFENAEYTFTFYNQIPERYEITKVKEIVITDLDISHYSCHYKLSEEDQKYFEFEYYSNVVENKQCRPHLIARSAITAPFDRTIIFQSQDDSEPTHTGETKLIIKVVQDDNVEFKFTQSEYFMKLQRNSKTIIPYENYEIPNLANGLDSYTHFKITDEEYAEQVRVNADQLTGALRVELIENVILCQTCDKISFPIEATWKGRKTTTTLTVLMSDDVEPPSTSTTVTTPSTSSSTSGTGSPSTSPTPTTPDGPKIVGVGLGGFTSFMLTSTVGLISIFVVVSFTFTAMIYTLRKLYFKKDEGVRCDHQVQQQAGPLPEKMPFP